MCDVWHVMCDVTCHMTFIAVPCWCWGGDISIMVSHMGSRAVSSDLWHLLHVMCDMWCVMWHVIWRVLQSHVDGGVVRFLKWCHTWGPGLFPEICNICDMWCVTCDVWCVMWPVYMNIGMWGVYPEVLDFYVEIVHSEYWLDASIPRRSPNTFEKMVKIL